MPKVGTVLALKQEQTARVVAELEKPEKKKVIVVWNKLCTSDPVTCIDECSIPIVESETVARNTTSPPVSARLSAWLKRNSGAT